MSDPFEVDEIGSGIWTVRAPLSLAGAQFGTRMTVVRVAEGGLVLFAPIEIDEALAEKIAALGPVRAIVAPNAFHHLYLLAALARYPEAACFLAEGVEGKLGQRPAGAQDLTDSPDPLWQDELAQVVLQGVPLTHEAVFFHSASKTLILTDLCFNFDPAPRGWTGFFLRLAGAHGGLAVSRLMRAGIKDKSALRASIDRILEWDFEQIVVTHGEVLRTDAKSRLRAALASI